MPGHKAHDLIGTVVAGVNAPVLLLNDVDPHIVAAYTAAILAGTYFLSPDLDIDSQIHRRWGVLRIIWWPYKKMVGHRSVWSHSGFSVYIRLIYLLWPVFLTPWRDDIITYCVANSVIFVAILKGLFISDITHCVADKVSTLLKRGFR